MALALFDLDHTLVNTDTPMLWFRYLIDKKVLSEDDISEKAANFYNDYRTGQLNYSKYIKFELQSLSPHPMQQLLQWREEFRTSLIRQHISEDARKLLQQHRAKGDTLLIVTATNHFIAQASALELDIEHVLATKPVIINNRFNGEYEGTECFQGGKIKKLEQWMQQYNQTLQHSHFYSDSFNDLPLLEKVTHPVVVNADEKLTAIAAARGWPSITL
jgi:HAD superfamily hydrolase (TIGR01490 family)